MQISAPYRPHALTKTKTEVDMRNIYAEIKHHQLKRNTRRERNEAWTFTALSVLFIVNYVVWASF